MWPNATPTLALSQPWDRGWIGRHRVVITGEIISWFPRPRTGCGWGESAPIAVGSLITVAILLFFTNGQQQTIFIGLLAVDPFSHFFKGF